MDYSGTTELWDVAGPGPGRKLGESGVGRGGIGVAFAPAGHLMATGLASGALVLDDVTDPARPAARGHTPDTRTASAGVVAPVFTPDGKRLITAAADTPPTVWEVTAPDQPRVGATL